MFQVRRWIQQDGMRVAVAAERLGDDSEASAVAARRRARGLNGLCRMVASSCGTRARQRVRFAGNAGQPGGPPRHVLRSPRSG